MKSVLIIVVFLLGTGCAWTIAHAQGVPVVCAQCTGTPEYPRCDGGLSSGADVCSIQGHSCSTAGTCGGGGGCFVGGTMVDTPNGLVSIEDLRIGDKVLGVSDEGSFVINEVISTYHTLTVTYFVLNGEISVTGTHPFMVAGSWVEAQNIHVGDTLTGDDGAPVMVTLIDVVDHGVRVFNIAVSGNHTFFAGGSLVHNKEPIPGS